MFIACDESGTDSQSKYLAIGSVVINWDCVGEFEKGIAELRRDYKIWGEIKFSKVGSATSKNIIEFYKNFLIYSLDKDYLRFRVIILDKQLIGKQDEQKVQLKLLYYSISRYANKFFSEDEKIRMHIVYDTYQESSESRAKQWRQKTRENIEEYVGCEIEHFQPCDSKISSAIQLCDLMTGIVLHKWNNATSSDYNELVEVIKDKINRPDIYSPTYPDEERFNVWLYGDYWQIGDVFFDSEL